MEKFKNIVIIALGVLMILALAISIDRKIDLDKLNLKLEEVRKENSTLLQMLEDREVSTGENKDLIKEIKSINFNLQKIEKNRDEINNSKKELDNIIYDNNTISLILSDRIKTE